MKKSPIKLQIALLLYAAALILEITPYGVAMKFSDAGGVTLTETYSYFSLLPYGYGILTPLPTALLTSLMLVYTLILLLKKTYGRVLSVLSFVTAFILIILAVLPAFAFCVGVNYFTYTALIVSVLVVIASILVMLDDRRVIS